jgi:hypothetical protein
MWAAFVDGKSKVVRVTFSSSLAAAGVPVRRRGGGPSLGGPERDSGTDRQIANASIRGMIERACREAGMQPPIICTPEELLEA